MVSSGKRSKAFAVGAAIVVGSMIAVGAAVNSLYPDDWRSTEAAVRATRTAHVGSRTPEWVLRVDASYVVAGRPYTASTDVFRNPERSITEAESLNWPPGRTFKLYFNAEDPESVSIISDGGRKAVTVLAVILTPLVVILASLIVVMMRRRQTTSNG